MGMFDCFEADEDAPWRPSCPECGSFEMRAQTKDFASELRTVRMDSAGCLTISDKGAFSEGAGATSVGWPDEVELIGGCTCSGEDAFPSWKIESDPESGMRRVIRYVGPWIRCGDTITKEQVTEWERPDQ